MGWLPRCGRRRRFGVAVLIIPGFQAANPRPNIIRVGRRLIGVGGARRQGERSRRDRGYGQQPDGGQACESASMSHGGSIAHACRTRDAIPSGPLARSSRLPKLVSLTPPDGSRGAEREQGGGEQGEGAGGSRAIEYSQRLSASAIEGVTNLQRMCYNFLRLRTSVLPHDD